MRFAALATCVAQVQRAGGVRAVAVDAIVSAPTGIGEERGEPEAGVTSISEGH